jgi:predicted nucleotidyltransferase
MLANVTVVPWLDERTAGLVRAITATVARRHPDLWAIILYGSVARHDERPLDLSRMFGQFLSRCGNLS